MTALRLLLAATLALAPVSAYAGAGTITTKDAAGVTRTFVVVTDGTGNFVASSVLCDATAAASCATVTSGRLITAPTLLSGSINSGAFASGALASGSVASGALAAGSIASGAMVDLGAIADAAATAGSTGTVSAKLRLVTTQLSTLGTPLQAATALPTGTNLLGKVGIDQTTPGTTNGVFATLNAETTKVIGVTRGADGAGNLITSTGNAWDVNIKSGGNANGQAVMASSSPTTMATDQRVSNANATANINISSATTTQLVALSGTTKIYVTSYRVMASGTGTFAFVYGTGSNCGTGTTTIDGPFSLTAQAGLAPGGGIGSIITVPAGQALCATTTGAGTWNGSVTTQQF